MSVASNAAAIHAEIRRLADWWDAQGQPKKPITLSAQQADIFKRADGDVPRMFREHPLRVPVVET